jgi:hypothetical protein
VEVTLALLVVAIGLTATFALFPEGLRATRTAVDDTEVALFAEYVFNTLDLVAGYNGDSWSVDKAKDFKSRSFADNDPTQLETGTGKVFYWIPEDYDLGDGNYNAAKDAGFWTSAFTYDLKVIAGGEESGVIGWKYPNTPGVVKSVVLKVWPGEYKGVAPAGEPRVFYREILPLW